VRSIWVYQLHWRPTLWDDMTDDELAVIEEHDRYVDGLHRDGRIVLGGAAMDPPRGMVFLHAEDEDAARAIMTADPCSQAGIVSVTLSAFGAGYVGSDAGYNHLRDGTENGQPAS
jgi:uncharacterized protein YciI